MLAVGVGHRLLRRGGPRRLRPQAGHLGLQLEHPLDAVEVQPLVGELLYAPELVDVGVAVPPAAAVGAGRVDEPLALVDPQRLRVDPGGLRCHGDHVDRPGLVSTVRSHARHPSWTPRCARGNAPLVAAARASTALRSSSFSSGRRHVDRDEQVAGLAPVVHAPALHPQRAARRGAGRDADLHRAAVERRHAHVRAQRRLGERDRHRQRQVVAPPAEQPVRRHACGDRSPGGPPLRPGPRPRRRMRCPSATPTGIRTLTSRAGARCRCPAGGARVLDEEPRPRAVGARLGEAEEPLVVEHAPPVALRAGVGRGARPGARPVAGRAGGLVEVDRGGDAPHRVLEVEVQLGLQVLAPVGAGAPARAAGRAAAAALEQAAQDVAEVADVLEPEPAAGRGGARRRTCRRPGPSCGPRRTPCASRGRRPRRARPTPRLKRSSAAVSSGLVSGWYCRESFRYALDVLGGGGVAHPEDPVVVLLEPLALGRHADRR